MENNKCTRCNGPEGAINPYGYFGGPVCKACWRELNLLALKRADRAANVDVVAIQLALEARIREAA
jgi:recombinational DNA repair protein (RecF pathway)